MSAEIAQKVFDQAKVEPFGETQTLDTPEEIAYYLGSTNYPFASSSGCWSSGSS